MQGNVDLIDAVHNSWEYRTEQDRTEQKLYYT